MVTVLSRAIGFIVILSVAYWQYYLLGTYFAGRRSLNPKPQLNPCVLSSGVRVYSRKKPCMCMEDKRFNGDCWDSWVAAPDVAEVNPKS